MNFRKAELKDLNKIKTTYKEIIEDMKTKNVDIWDEIYPCSFFEDDIKNNRLYILLNEEEIVAAFALCEANAGESFCKWKENCREVLYLDRLGVNVKYSRQGIGTIMLKHAIDTAKELKAKYLRLFVVDCNYPAINLYSKNSFTRVEGIYHEIIDDDFILKQYGYEIKI